MTSRSSSAGAVGAPEVRELVAALRPRAQLGVVEGDEQVVERDVVVARATDADADPGSLAHVADDAAEDAADLDRPSDRGSLGREHCVYEALGHPAYPRSVGGATLPKRGACSLAAMIAISVVIYRPRRREGPLHRRYAPSATESVRGCR
jgi:hypothetical protein